MMNTKTLSEEFQEILPRLYEGDPAAIEVVDMLHTEGSLSKEDYKYVRDSFATLITEGNPAGLVCMGLSFTKGCEKDMDKAARYFFRAAQRGNPSGLRLYGAYCWEKSFEIAAEYENRPMLLKAMDWLTGKYRKASPADKKVTEALISLKVASMLGDSKSTHFMKEIELNLFNDISPEGLEEIEKKADEFLGTI